jgi:ArsR family transcriptional regulator, lead/cadmium/zinc/bismuth-responsive transcriptional repressor
MADAAVRNSTRDVCNIPCFNQELVAGIRLRLPQEEAIDRWSVLHGALADATRLKILLALGHGELCVCDITHVLGLSVSAISHQLRKLRHLGLVRFRTDGKMAYYSLVEDSPARAWIDQIQNGINEG